MKKFLLIGLAIVIFVSGFSTSVLAEENLLTLTQEAGYPATADMLPEAYIVIDAESGQLLSGENMDKKWDPASTTKTMVIYLTFEAIAQGKIGLDTEVVATETDQAIAGIYALSNNKIVAGQSYTVEELLTMTLVPSSNVTTLMLAHLIHDGDDASFIQYMNETAKELGMTNTTFHNATGAVVAAFEGYYAPVGYDHTRYNEVTAKDMAILTYHLLKKHPKVLEFTNKTAVTVKAGTPYEETFEAYNHSLPEDPMGIPGVDGLKTGSSPSAGYNALVTAKRGDTRLIVTMLGVSEWGDPNGEFVRHYFINTLLEKSFSEYKRQVLAEAGEQQIDGQTVKTKEDLFGLVRQDEVPELIFENNQLRIKNSIIESSGVSAEIVEKSATVTVQQPSAKTKKSGIQHYFPLFFAAIVPILLVGLHQVSLAKKRAARKSQPLETLNAPRSRRQRYKK